MRVIASTVWVLTLLLSPYVKAAVLAIDFGAEFTKLSLIKPGVPFDVVLDKDSKRKISSVVGWKRDDRVFGADGKMAATRFPETHFPYVKSLLGSSNLPELPIFPSPPSIINNTVMFPHSNPPPHLDIDTATSKGVHTSTALLAHQLSYFRALAGLLAGESVKDVIVTVPAWFTQPQRRAYRDALELQGMSCLAMISEGTAVGLNYAMTRTFPDYNPETGVGQKEYHMIYDSGALSTTASILAFYQTSVLPTPKSKTPINTTHIEMMGVGWSSVGGVHLDMAIQDLLVKDFKEKSKLDVREDKRAIAKLNREANRVKHILSANQESNVAVESLYEDRDYKSRLSRSSLEDALSSSVSSFSSPITTALYKSNLTLSDISSVILFGGNTRVPLVQSAIRSVLGDKEDLIAQNVNSDEAAVLGAAFWGAALSRQFKMKSIELHEKSVFEYSVGDGVVVFPAGTELGKRKALELAPVDQSVEVLQDGHPLFAIEFNDVASSLENFTSSDPILNLTFRLDQRGHIAAANAVIVSNSSMTEPETTSGGMAGAIKGFFGKKDKEPQEGDATVEGEDDVDAAANETQGIEGEKVEKKKDAKKEKVVVKFRERGLGLRGITGEEKKTILSRLTSTATYEAAKTAREEARNVLEGYLYRLSSLLAPDSDNKALQDFSTPEEQTKLRKLMDDSFEWMSEHAEKAEEKALKARRAALEAIEEPIVVRFKESQTRPKAVQDFQQAMFAARGFLVEATKNNTIAKEAQESATPENPVPPPKYTDEELKTVQDLMKENEIWMDSVMTEQVKIEEDKTKDPVVLTKDLDEKGKKLQMTVIRLEKKKPPRAPRPKASTASSASSAESETASTTTSSTTSTPSGSEETAAPPKHEEL